MSEVSKQTPSDGLSWWLKWAGSISGMCAAILTSMALTPWNLIAGLICFLFWSVVGMMWRDRSLIVMNIFLTGVYTHVLLAEYVVTK